MTLKDWNALPARKRKAIAKIVFHNMPEWYIDQFVAPFNHSYNYVGEPEGCMVKVITSCCKKTPEGNVEVTVKKLV